MIAACSVKFSEAARNQEEKEISWSSLLDIKGEKSPGRPDVVCFLHQEWLGPWGLPPPLGPSHLKSRACTYLLVYAITLLWPSRAGLGSDEEAL